MVISVNRYIFFTQVAAVAEIAVLAQSFNRMHRSLSNAVAMLNESMDERDTRAGKL